MQAREKDLGVLVDSKRRLGIEGLGRLLPLTFRRLDFKAQAWLRLQKSGLSPPLVYLR